MGGHDNTLYLLQGASLLVALAAVSISILTFFRYDKWRRDDKTEITIKQIDTTAREGVSALGRRFEDRDEKVDAALQAVTRKIDAEIGAVRAGMSTFESDLRNSLQVFDSRLKRELTEQGKLLAALSEHARHAPTQGDMAKLSGQVEANGARTEGVSRLLERIDASVQRIEEHHFRDR